MAFYPKYILVFLVFGLLPADAAAQLPDSLTLEDFLAKAKQQAFPAEAASLDLAIADYRYGLYQADLRPQLRLNANFPNYFKTFSEITQPDGTILFQPITNNNSSVGLILEQALPQTGGTLFLETYLQRFDNLESDFHLYNGLPIRLGLSQPIFAFNALKWDKRIMPLQLQADTRRYAADMAVVEVTATQLFFDLLVAQRDAEIAQANINANQTLYDIAQERYALGKISRRDLVQLELGLLSAQKNQMLAQSNAANAAAEVYAYLGLPYEEQGLIPISPDPFETQEIAEAKALEEALRNRPKLIDLAVQRLSADRELERARRDNGPQLSLYASFGLVRSSTALSDLYSDPRNEQIVQLRLNVPILDGGRRKHAVALASAQKDYTERQARQSELDLRKAVLQQVRSFRILQDEIQLAAEMEVMARERLEITTESYVLGAISLTELTLAQSEKDQSTRTYTNTLRRYYEAYAELRKLTLHEF